MLATRRIRGRDYRGSIRGFARPGRVQADGAASAICRTSARWRAWRSGALGDLLAATESVGDDQPVGGRVADGGEKFEFADGRGDVVLVALEAEGAGHAAASGSGLVEVDAEAAEEGFFGGHLHDGLVMAVSVEQGFAVELRAAGPWPELRSRNSLSRNVCCSGPGRGGRGGRD